MNEARWLAATDTWAMLDRLWASGRAGGRKLRLFACACVGRAWDRLADGRSRRAVEVAVRLSDGRATPGEQRDAREAAWAAFVAADLDIVARFGTRECDPAAKAVHAAAFAAYEAVAWDGTPASWFDVAHEAHRADRDAAAAGGVGEAAAQAALLRDIVGRLPFRPLPAAEAAWLRWEGGLAVALAVAAYDDPLLPPGALDPARLAVLADALEEAGCGEAELLGHLRGPGPHVRGCWAVDLLLGKE
jgi:hypothetical protein